LKAADIHANKSICKCLYFILFLRYSASN